MRLDFAFDFVRAASLVGSWGSLPDDEGVYLLFARGGDRLVGLSGYYDEADEVPWSYGDYDHLYTGKAQNLRRRVKRHVAGDCATSNLRRTLRCLEDAYRALSRSGSHIIDLRGERALSMWIEENVLIAFKPTARSEWEEQAILTLAPSPLNINGRRARRYQKNLMSLLREQELGARIRRNPRADPDEISSFCPIATPPTS